MGILHKDYSLAMRLLEDDEKTDPVIVNTVTRKVYIYIYINILN